MIQIGQQNNMLAPVPFCYALIFAFTQAMTSKIHFALIFSGSPASRRRRSRRWCSAHWSARRCGRSGSHIRGAWINSATMSSQIGRSRGRLRANSFVPIVTPTPRMLRSSVIKRHPGQSSWTRGSALSARSRSGPRPVSSFANSPARSRSSSRTASSSAALLAAVGRCSCNASTPS